jgi:hypothetical protein
MIASAAHWRSFMTGVGPWRRPRITCQVSITALFGGRRIQDDRMAAFQVCVSKADIPQTASSGPAAHLAEKGRERTNAANVGSRCRSPTDRNSELPVGGEQISG